MAGEPIIYSKNYVNKDDIISASSNQNAVVNLYDRDVDTLYVSTGEDDTETVIIQVDFYEGIYAISRAIDTLILLNHNLKDFHLRYWDGSVWVPISATIFSVNLEENLVVSFAEVETTSVQLVMYKTIIANYPKNIGELIICEKIIQFENDFSSYSEEFSEQVNEYSLIDGTRERIFVKWTANKYTKYGCSWDVSAISKSARDSLFAVKESGVPFLWQPESVVIPEKIYYVHWTSTWKSKYYSGCKGSGYNISGDFKEV